MYLLTFFVAYCNAYFFKPYIFVQEINQIYYIQMTRKYNLLVLFFGILFTTLCLSGCSEEEVLPADPNNGNEQYLGQCKEFLLVYGMDSLQANEGVLHILAPNGNIIKRQVSHIKNNGVSMLVTTEGLSDNNYRLLYIEHDNPNPVDSRFTKIRFGIGCEVSIINAQSKILDIYNTKLRMYEKHDEERTFYINTDADLRNLAKSVNSQEHNIDSTYTFIQTCNIDLGYACYKAHHEYGWDPIGNSNETPFMAKYIGDTITYLDINRPHTYGVGLFGYANGAHIKDVCIINSSIRGDYATGGMVGVVSTSGGMRNTSIIENCTIINSTIRETSFYEDQDGVNIGGLVGTVEENAVLVLTGSVSRSNNIQAVYNAGGLVGGGTYYSHASITNCLSDGNNIVAQSSGAGGIIATADTVEIMACTNSSSVTGGAVARDHYAIGVGGIVGGCGPAIINTCKNTGSVKGQDGTGGIVGSSRINGNCREGDPLPFIYNDIMLSYCVNTGKVEGLIAVGGICGEGNLATFGSYSTGALKGQAQVGGIIGASGMAVVHNCLNTGSIEAEEFDDGSFSGGIIGKADMISAAMCQNYGTLTSKGTHLGGIVGLGGATSVIHQCANFGDVKTASSGAVGGIVGELGTPEDWGPANKAMVAMGVIETVFAFAGPIVGFCTSDAVKGVKYSLVVVDKLLSIGCFSYDIYSLADGVEGYNYFEQLKRIKTSVDQKIVNIQNTISSDLDALRSSCTKDISIDGFDPDIFSDSYMTQIDSTISYYKQNNGCETYNNNINDKRNDLAQKVEAQVSQKQQDHNIVAGVALSVGLLAFGAGIAASIYTGGASLAVGVCTTLSIMTGVMGGVNSIIAGATDLQQNAVIISQCVSAGTVSGKSSAKTGGFVGVLNDFAIVRDCLNASNGDNVGAHFVGTTGNWVKLQQCLSVGKNWENYTIYNVGNSMDINHLYLYGSKDNNFIGNVLSKNEVSNPKSYEKWDIGDGTNRWTMPKSDTLCFPVPFYSEMR